MTEVNFGGFVPLSTVDWRGRAVCTVFMRGCPVRCYYCHNIPLQTGTDMRDTGDIIQMVKDSRLAVSGVIFSGGEPTAQKDALIDMMRKCRKLGLKIGVQTNGMYPETLCALLEEKLLDLVHMDIKTRWEHYPKLLKVAPWHVDRIKESFEICRAAHESGELPEFQAVCTLFPGREDDVTYISKQTEGADLVLQQGICGGMRPLTFDDLKKCADKIGRPVRIRTREDGEVSYSCGKIIVAGSIVLTDILQARRNY